MPRRKQDVAVPSGAAVPRSGRVKTGLSHSPSTFSRSLVQLISIAAKEPFPAPEFLSVAQDLFRAEAAALYRQTSCSWEVISVSGRAAEVTPQFPFLLEQVKPVKEGNGITSVWCEQGGGWFFFDAQQRCALFFRPVGDTRLDGQRRAAAVATVQLLLPTLFHISEARLSLEQSEQRYRRAARAGRVGVWEWVVGSNELFIADELRQMLGYSVEELPNRLDCWCGLVHLEDKEQVIGATQAYLEGRADTYEIEVRRRHRSGEYLWFLARGYLEQGIAGRQMRLIGSDTDITERKRTEEALRHQEQFNRRILESSDDAVLVVGADGRIIAANRSARLYLGGENIVARFWSELWRGEHAQIAGTALVQGISGEGSRFVAANCHADGSERWWEVITSPMQEPSGALQVLALARDVTAIHRAEQARAGAEFELSRTSETLKRMVAASPLAITVLNSDGTVRMWNGAAERLLGWTQDEVLGASMPAFAEQESQRVFQSLEENRKLQTCQGVETVLQKRDGQPIQVEIWTSLLGNQEGVAEGIILIVADITGRKAAENALQESQERLRLALVAARVGVWELDPIHQELSLSDRAREILGTQGQPRIPYRSLLEGVVAGDRARVHETFEARLSSDESSDFTLEFEFHPRAGEWRFIVVHGRKLSTKARGEGVASERLIGTVADNTERKKAEALLLEQNRRLQLLSEATGYLLKTENTEEMLCTLFRRLSDVFGFEFCSTHVLSSSGDYLELSTTSGDTRLNSVARVELSHPVFGRALLEQEAITWSGGSLSGDAEEVFKSSGIAALVAFPLKAGERLLGVLSFGSSKGITWSASDLEFLGTIADHVSVAKDRMQLLNAFVTRAQQLAQSEAEFRQLADSMPQIVWSASPAGSFEYLNRRWAEVTGQTAPADGVVEWDRFLHPDDVPSWAEYWAQSLASGHPFQMEYRLRDRVSGEFRWHLGRAVPVAAEGGKIGGWFGTSTDIHDQKCAQLRLRILSDASALLNWSHDYEFALRNVARLVVPELADWCIIEVAVEEEEPRSMVAVVHQESAKVQLFRHSREQLGVPLLSPAHREGGTPGPLLEISGAALQEIWSGYAESEVVKTLGWQSMVCFPLQARDRNFGTLTVAMAESRRRIGPEEIEFFVDLASRAAVAVDNARLAATAEQQRRVAEQNERYYRTLSETIPHLVWTGNNLGIIDDCNSRWTEYTGLTAEDTVAHGWSHVIHPDDRDRALETWQQSIASGEAFEIECRFRRASDSSYRWHIGRALPLRDALGNNMKWFGTWTDIHDQKSAENALKMVQEQLSDYAMHLEERVLERTAELQETIKSLEGFCYSIAHDLRAPLRATKGFTRILLEEYASGFDETGRDYANRIIEATSRMDRLIQDLLDYGRLAHVELSFDSVDLNSVVRMVLKVLADEITAKQGVVTVMPDMPAVLANPVVLEQILVNLVGNSLKFVTPGSSPQIEINAVARPENRVVISVKDHGIGIAKEHQERIFRVFERLNVKEFPGTGIGLAIVQKGVERMGGKVWVESEPGLGSCFSFDLPTPEHRPTLLDRRARLEKARQVQTPEPGLRAGA